MVFSRCHIIFFELPSHFVSKNRGRGPPGVYIHASLYEMFQVNY